MKAGRFAAASFALALAACAALPAPPLVHQPMSARPAPAAPSPAAGGAIYREGGGQLVLFEDRRARSVGDTLVVVITERISASKRSNSSAERSSGTDFSVAAVKGLPGKSLQGATLQAGSDMSFSGKGESAANNDFTGTIAVTVIDVLPNGNLLVSGEKQIAVNQGTEFIRFSGVVNPAAVSGNTVLSTQVADARIEYRAQGYIDEAQVMGWLARFFLNVLPF